MQGKIRLPRLDLLTPTLDSTLLKIIEEAGELARAVLIFIEFQDQAKTANMDNSKLRDVAAELLDVAQTCVTMIFVLEEHYAINPGEMIDAHLRKLLAKGYLFNPEAEYYIETNGHYKYLNLPRLDIPQVGLLKTVCKIQEEIGELTQILGKRSGKSGEKIANPSEKAVLLKECALELLDIAQCCFTMLYILEDRYQILIEDILQHHLEKLSNKGYCT